MAEQIIAMSELLGRTPEERLLAQAFFRHRTWTACQLSCTSFIAGM